MKDIDYGYVTINLETMMEEQQININKLAFRAEMQRTQLKTYIKNSVQRVDLAVLARLCYALECSLDDLITYTPPKNAKKDSKQV